MMSLRCTSFLFLLVPVFLCKTNTTPIKNYFNKYRNYFQKFIHRIGKPSSNFDIWNTVLLYSSYILVQQETTPIKNPYNKINLKRGMIRKGLIVKGKLG